MIQIWECELKPAVREKTLQSLLYTLSQIELSVTGSRRFELPTEEFQLVADSAVVSYDPKE
ncbi:MAG: hypothetical protein IJP70_02110 [Bacteroidales bacterium]|nr:hypothetical protein [Bacteroidales bacterium]